MRRVGVVFILMGVIFALLAGVLLFVLFPRQSQPVPEPTLDLVVAFQNIPQRTEIGPDQVGKSSWPQHIPTPIGAFANPDEVVGKLAQVPIYPGEPIIQPMLLDKGQLKETHSNAAYIVAPGTLAVALPVNTTSNVAEAVQAGDRVDLVATFSITGTLSTQGGTASEVVVTQRLLQDVLVLEVGTWPRPGPPQPQAASPIGGGATTQVSAETQTQSNPAPVIITLQLAMQDVLVLKSMQANATDFTLALRPVNDHALANPTPVTLDYMQKRFNFRLTDIGR